MSSRVARKSELHRARLEAQAAARRAERARALRVRVLVATALAVIGLAALFVLNNTGKAGHSSSSATAGTSGAYPYAVGSPGPEAPAPPIRLASTSGKTFDLG